MILDDILHAERDAAEPYTPHQQSSAGTDLDALFQGRRAILQTKLEVFASELVDRLRIRTSNLTSISENQEHVQLMLEKLARQADYRLREHRDKGIFYQMAADLEHQKRQETVECWRDVTEVMKDFLAVWEALEQAKSRALFLNA